MEILIHVAPVSPALAGGVRAVEVHPEQAPFVGNIAFNLDDALDDPHSEPMAILANGRIIGYYRLDFSPPTMLGPQHTAPTVTLRSFTIDRRHQRKGYGERAMQALERDVVKRHPDRRLMVLAVNHQNHVANMLYRRAGFVTTGLSINGRAGRQYVLLKPLPVPGRALLYV